jgi:hypothetical protein
MAVSFLKCIHKYSHVYCYSYVTKHLSSHHRGRNRTEGRRTQSRASEKITLLPQLPSLQNHVSCYPRALLLYLPNHTRLIFTPLQERCERISFEKRDAECPVNWRPCSSSEISGPVATSPALSLHTRRSTRLRPSSSCSRKPCVW